MPKKKKSPSKKRTKKHSPAKKRSSGTKKVYLPKTELGAEKILIENFVSLQKVMVNLSVKFDSLTTQISKLLELFEISAKSLAEKDFDLEKSNKENTKIIEKIDNILDQNKTIARGLTLMHEKITGSASPPPMPAPPMPQKMMPRGMPMKPLPKPTVPHSEPGEYSRSISSQNRKFQ